MSEELLLPALGDGSADRFTLRNHRMTALLLRAFADSAFPTDYAIKDARCAIALAGEVASISAVRISHGRCWNKRAPRDWMRAFFGCSSK